MCTSCTACRYSGNALAEGRFCLKLEKAAAKRFLFSSRDSICRGKAIFLARNRTGDVLFVCSQAAAATNDAPPTVDGKPDRTSSKKEASSKKASKKELKRSNPSPPTIASHRRRSILTLARRRPMKRCPRRNHPVGGSSSASRSKRRRSTNDRPTWSSRTTKVSRSKPPLAPTSVYVHCRLRPTTKSPPARRSVHCRARP